MLVFIDNTKTEENVFFVSKDGKDWNPLMFQGENEGSLERSFEKMLGVLNISLHDIKGLAVKVGTGRFTATRIAVTFANTMAMSLKIPVVAMERDDLSKIAQILNQTPIGVYISAKYSAEPRLGGKLK